MAGGAEELGRLVDAEPRSAGGVEHRVRLVVPLKPQQRLGLQRHYLVAEFTVTEDTHQVVESKRVTILRAASVHSSNDGGADLWSAVGAVGHGALRFLEHRDPVPELARVVALGDAGLRRLRARNVCASGFLGRLLQLVDGLVRFS